MVTSQREALTTGEAARALALSTQRIRQLVDEGKLDATRTPYGLLFTRETIEAEQARRASKAAR